MQNIKYDPEQWVDVKAGGNAPCPRKLHVKLKNPSAVEVDFGDGKYRLIGYGTEIKATLPAAGKVRSESAFAVFVGTDVETVCQGQPLTNFDKRPGASAVEQMIRRAFREKALQDRAKAEARARANFELNEKRKEKGLQEGNEVKDPDDVEPVGQGEELPPETETETAPV